MISNTCRPIRHFVFFAAGLAALLAAGLPGLAQQNARKQPEETIHDLAAELKNFSIISMLPAYRTGSIEAQVSTWDTTGGNDDGFNGTYSFVRRNRDGSLVLADLHGPGVINRIWTPTPTEDTLDFFIDDNRRPRLSIKYADLFSGKVFPFVAPLCGNQLGGYYCYFPILFQKSCRILCRASKTQFHQIQYRLFPEKSRVQSFSLASAQAEKKTLDRMADLWNTPTKTVSDFLPADQENMDSVMTSFILKPGSQEPIFRHSGGGRILGIVFDVENASMEFNKNIDLKISWDADRQPAVDCPVADFFGYSFGEPSMESLLLGSHSHQRYCYFPMPFDRHASVSLVYRDDGSPRQAIPVRARVYYSPVQRDSLKEGRFYTCWNSDRLQAGDKAHVFLDAVGKGHYTGTILQAQGLRPGMTYFFEGDDSTATDGHFRLHGTGSEDYFNGGWYAFQDRWDGRMSLPLHGCLDYSLPFSRTGGYRFYLNDKIPFEKDIFLSIEHGPVRNEIPVSYTSLAFYYGDRPALRRTEPRAALTDVLQPDTLMIYPQLVNFNVWDNIQIRSENLYPTGGANFLFTVTDESRLRMPLDNIPAGHYSVWLDFAKRPDAAGFSLWQRQTPVSEWIEAAAPKAERVALGYLGKIQITHPGQTLSFRFRTDEKHNRFLMNSIILVKARD